MKTRNFLCLALFALLTPFALFAEAKVVVEDQPAALEMARSLCNVGTLGQEREGHLYLDVTDEFITKVLPLIECEGRVIPPRHFLCKKMCPNLPGAHISVIYQNERVKQDLWEISEIGNNYAFEVKEIQSVKVCCKGRLNKYWVLTVEAPELENLRESYALANKIKGREFHITIGRQIPCAQCHRIGREDDLHVFDFDRDEQIGDEDENPCDETCYEKEADEDICKEGECDEECRTDRRRGPTRDEDRDTQIYYDL